jgi:hypothetical protein
MIPKFTQTLQAFQIPLDTYEASQFLKRVRSAIDYLIVYQHYFPAEYTQSMELVRTGQAPLFPKLGQAYSPHEIQMLKLIDEHLFPLPLWYVLDELDEEHRCNTIPIEPFGIDLSNGDDFLEMDLSWQLIYCLVGEIREDFFKDALGDEWDTIFAVEIERGKVDDETLKEVVARETESLTFFRDVIDMIDNSTGTVWLDATMEMPCDNADWSIATIDILVEQYGQALSIKNNADQFMNWLAGDIEMNFTEVIRIWNKCVIQTKQKRG